MEEDQRCPEDLLERPDKGKLNHWLSRFVAEVCNKKGELYTPHTIVLAGCSDIIIILLLLRFSTKMSRAFVSYVEPVTMCTEISVQRGLELRYAKLPLLRPKKQRRYGCHRS